jgi:hypothetical protein
MGDTARHQHDADLVTWAQENTDGWTLDLDTAALFLREMVRMFVPGGFRDEDGVWHDGPNALASNNALDALVARVEAAERDRDQAVAAMREIQRRYVRTDKA